MAKKNSDTQANVSAQDETTAQLLAELKEAKAKLAAAEARNKGVRKANLTIKVSQKGGVSVYGMGRFPTTLYPTQWERLFMVMPEIKAMIEEDRERPGKDKQLKWDK
jgi:hypothetical protein